MKLLLIGLLLATQAFAKEPDVDFDKKWSYTKLQKQNLKNTFSTKFFKRYIVAGKKHWPISEVIYTQFEPGKTKINLNTIMQKRIKVFDKVNWSNDKRNGAIIKRGFWRKGNRFVELYIWKRPKNGYAVLTTLTRRAYFKTVNKELAFIHHTLQNPKSKITQAFNYILDTAIAQDSFGGSNRIFDDVMITTALETGLIPVLTNEGGTTFIAADEATQAQLIIWDNEKEKFEDFMKAEEKKLREQEKEARKQHRELQAQEREEDKQSLLAEEAALELKEMQEAIARQETLIEDYKAYDAKLRDQRTAISKLEIMADEIVLVLEEIESQNNPEATIEDIIIKYSTITGREPELDCVDCIQTQLIEFNTGAMNRLLNFLHQARLDGRDPKMAFCKKLEDIINTLITLEHFNQDARMIILAAENAAYGRVMEETDQREGRYDTVNSNDFLKERASLRGEMNKRINDAQKVWAKNNKKQFKDDCVGASTTGLPEDASDLMKSSHERAQEIIASHHPIGNIGDFFWQFFIWGNPKAMAKRACNQVWKEVLKPKAEDNERSDTVLAMTPEQISVPMENAMAYFDKIRLEVECYSRLRITTGPRADNVGEPGNNHKYANPRHFTDPSRIKECKEEGAADAISLYNLKKKLLEEFNNQQCPRVIEQFYEGMANSGQTNLD